MDQNVYRILDANFNRAREALRVCEDIARFVLDDRTFVEAFKAARHSVSGEAQKMGIKTLTEARDTDGDEGRDTRIAHESQENVRDLFYANAQRAKESLRVLEEFSKIVGGDTGALERLRFDVYGLEKKGAEKLDIPDQ